MPRNSNKFQRIGKFLRTSIDNLVLRISLKFQIDQVNRKSKM